jgi:hypothetical protein
VSDSQDRAADFKNRINLALNFLAEGQPDGAHHLKWVIDQTVRILTNCPVVARVGVDANGTEYEYSALGENDLYRKFVREACAGEDGPDTYSWDVGIPP